MVLACSTMRPTISRSTRTRGRVWLTLSILTSLKALDTVEGSMHSCNRGRSGAQRTACASSSGNFI
ncbi:hypothetical protein PF003_g22236 [Phytophthora fragariae]|nr:hypothetical protein PF003_g22236 [Phytophthora fragariae]